MDWKNFEARHVMQYGVIAICGALLLLILLTMFTTYRYTREFRDLDKVIADRITTLSAVDSTSTNQMIVISQQDFEDILEVKAIESNDYLAIILTLITLSVTLSAVIPYIVGKSVTDNQVRETVEDVQKRQNYESEKKYKEAISKLEAAEGHLSRMVAYQLVSSVKKEKFAKGTDVTSATYDIRLHPFWALGWSAKSLIRYMKVAQNSKVDNKFTEYCCQYIKTAASCISNISVDNLTASDQLSDINGKLVRGFIDLFDALGFYYSYRYSGRTTILSIDQLTSLESMLGNLYDIIIKISTHQELLKAVKAKSKYKLYLGNDGYSAVSMQTCENYLNEWADSRTFNESYFKF